MGRVGGVESEGQVEVGWKEVVGCRGFGKYEGGVRDGNWGMRMGEAREVWEGLGWGRDGVVVELGLKGWGGEDGNDVGVGWG